MPIPFTKYSGCGNDFILIDNRQLNLTPSPHTLKRLCQRQSGVGADGLIFIENPTTPKAACSMRIFNADGSEAEMCGNGLRCVALHLQSAAHIPAPFSIQTMHQLMHVSFKEGLVHVAMPPPTPVSLKKIPLSSTDPIPFHYLNTGVPHAVHFVEDIENTPLFSIAPSIRSHPEFHPHGTNVNFVKILSNRSIAIRTYERGVEAETLACGTGAAAAAIAADSAFEMYTPIKVHTRSGDCIQIDFKKNGTQINDLVMAGPAFKTFEGFVDFN